MFALLLGIGAVTLAAIGFAILWAIFEVTHYRHEAEAMRQYREAVEYLRRTHKK
jgi:CHASE3 domain sensor protein